MVASPAIWTEFLCCLRISENFSEGDLDHFWHIDSVPVPECGNGSSCLLSPPPKMLRNMIIHDSGDINLGDINVRDIEFIFLFL